MVTHPSHMHSSGRDRASTRGRSRLRHDVPVTISHTVRVEAIDADGAVVGMQTGRVDERDDRMVFIPSNMIADWCSAFAVA